MFLIAAAEMVVFLDYLFQGGSGDTREELIFILLFVSSFSVTIFIALDCLLQPLYYQDSLDDTHDHLADFPVFIGFLFFYALVYGRWLAGRYLAWHVRHLGLGSCVVRWFGKGRRLV